VTKHGLHSTVRASAFRIYKLLSFSEVTVKIDRRQNPHVVRLGLDPKTSVTVGHWGKPHTSISAPLLSDLCYNRFSSKDPVCITVFFLITCKAVNLFLSSAHE
jgi:hypothetical protein